ncbi:hypothetical protein SpCBS45565_g01698 [Spizellomyces sp. 'palustris']|nr:hypothetical protein SpCBS45565_g01698 [Spizellomyces sp. 'palustris']
MTLSKAEQHSPRVLNILSLGENDHLRDKAQTPPPRLSRSVERAATARGKTSSLVDSTFIPNSAAIATIKANAVARDKDAQMYLRRFTTSSSAPLSATAKVGGRRAQTAKDLRKGRPITAGSRRWSLGNDKAEVRGSYKNHATTSNPVPITCSASSNVCNATFVRLDGSEVQGGMLPRPPELLSHTPAHSLSHPIGAYTAGFYARQHYAQSKTSNRPSAALLHERAPATGSRHTRAHTADGSILLRERDISFGDRRLRSGHPKAQNIEPQQLVADEEYAGRIRRTFTSSDMSALDSYLSTLTDTDCAQEQIVEALNCLIALAEENLAIATDVLYDKGAIQILLALMRKFPPDIVEVQIKSSALLQMVTERNALAKTSVYEQDGISTILEAMAGMGKVLADSRRSILADRSMSRYKPRRLATPGRSSTPVTGANGRSPDDCSTNSLVSLPLNDDAGKPTVIAIPSAPVTGFEDRSTPPQTPDGDERSLIAGLLNKYFQPQFLDHVEKTDKTTRSQIIKHLLVLFEKVDKLLSVSSSISLDVDLQSAMRQIIKDGAPMLQAEMILLFLVDRNGDLIPKDFATNSDVYDFPEVRHPPGCGIAGWVAQSERIANIRDAMHNERFEPEVDIRGTQILAHSILSVPIRTRDNTLKGVLQAVNKVSTNGNPMYFNHEDEFLIKALAQTAGVIIKNGQIYETMMKTQKKVEVLLETTRSLGSTLELDHLIKMIMDSAKELLSADRCTLFLRDSEGKYLRAHIQGRDSVQEIRIALNAGIAGYAYTSGDSVNIPDAYKDPRFNPEVDKQTGYVTKNILCMPIKNISGENIGVTQMINKHGGPFSADDESSGYDAHIGIVMFDDPTNARVRITSAAVAIEKSQLFKKTEGEVELWDLDMRAYLQSILSSITSCVITLSENMRMNTMNRPWFLNALGVTEEFVTGAPVAKWIGEKENYHLLNDVLSVYQQGTPVYSAEYELRGPKGSTFINYQIMPLLGEQKGVVMVLDDISAEKRAVMTLGRYMSPALAKQVMEEDGSQLGGKRKKVTILFSDIRAFTSIAESMEPHEVVELLNHHFSDAVNAIMSEQGILDKYIGDAVMAVFGVPFVSAEDGIHACNAALRMRDCLVILNEGRLATGKRPIKIGIGINTGMVLSGNIGSIKRMEFSCIGDSVNLASRTEGLTKAYNVTILVTENTLRETGDAFLTRHIDTVIVTGKSTKVDIFELLGRKGDILADEVVRAQELYATALSLYRQRNFAEAADLFAKAIEIADDGPSKTLLARCNMYIEHPPNEDWMGVHAAEGK